LINTLPILVSSTLMATSGLEVGDEVPLSTLPGYDGDGVIVGEIEEFPTVDPQTGAPIVLDYQSYLAAIYVPGSTTPAPEEYWLAVDEDALDAATSALAEEPYTSAEVASRAERELTLESDPVALGTIGSLMLGFVAAAVFAGIGFAVNAAVSARERLVEFALLRAVGLSNRQLLGWLSLENALLVVFGLVGGTLLGIGLAWLVLPLITITQEATQAVPGIIVVYPWWTILWLELGIIGVLAAAVGLLAFMLRRMGLGALLRLGEE
jgi:predicted lysophospholipase L1 biosynthesis ABC-type transport system permease subunit